MSNAVAHADAHGHAHAHHPALQHHFDTMGQQKEAAVVGMWVFLLTEILFFGGLFAAYMASRTLSAGTEYMQVFRIVATAAFMGYSLALAQNSIWYMKSWGATSRSMIDGLVYAMLTGGVFGWMWPGA